MDESSVSCFTVVITGQIDCAEIPSCDNAYVKFQVVSGEDWQVVDGHDEGITQASRSGEDNLLVWNHPLDLAFKSTNPFGWPQIIVSVYGLDGFGRDIIQGYGCIHVPVMPGRHRLKIRLFKPKSASILQQLIGSVTGMPPEFADPRFPSYGEGREVTRVMSSGYVMIQTDVITKDMDLFGYEDGTGRMF